MATCFGVSLAHLQTTVLKRYNQYVLCTVGTGIAYRVCVKLKGDIKVRVKVKYYWIGCNVSKKQYIYNQFGRYYDSVLKVCQIMRGFCNMCACIYSVLYCLYCVFVLFRLCIFILICFVCTSVRTAATE
jgi:hypothetical protein